MKLMQSAGAVQLSQRWAQLGSRERRMVAVAAALVGVALVWLLVLAPALRTLQQAPQQHAQLDAQLERMQQMSQQAKALQAMPKLGYDDALKALQASVAQHLGAGSGVSANAERVSVTLKAVKPEALAQWLVQARNNARAAVTEMRLTQTPSGWDGVVVLALPARQ
jgi:general secretion pathway protein M